MADCPLHGDTGIGPPCEPCEATLRERSGASPVQNNLDAIAAPAAPAPAGADRVLPGSRWRTLAHTADGSPIADGSDRHPPSVFDELVIASWFHLEQMDKEVWWMAIEKADGGNVTINVTVGDDGRATTVLVENDL